VRNCQQRSALLTEILENSSGTDIPAPSSEIASEHTDEMAAIFYTSGSTGEAKGVMLSHRNLVSNTQATVEYLRLTSDDSVMVILPFYYIYGNSLMLTHIAAGGTLVIDNRFMYPEVVLDNMESSGVTGFSGVPSHFMILLNSTTMVKRKFATLRYFTQAGGGMAPEVITKLADSFPQKEIWIMYGQTEASPRVTYLPPERLKEKLGSIGIPVPGVTVEIVNEKGEPMPAGEVGELTVIGDNVMLGYLNQPEETRSVLHHGRLWTGDLARRDEEGYIYITGRRREIIKTGGNRVSAREIEECLLKHPKVAEAAVFGYPDDLLGEAVLAEVVFKQAECETVDEIRSFCGRNLSVHKVPKLIKIREQLPKLATGKIDKVALRAEFSIETKQTDRSGK
ncbi:MAG: AMP-binding protein, partial [candidate division Zixibacteria bacterium]